MSNTPRTHRFLTATAVAAPLLAAPLAVPLSATAVPPRPQPAPPQVTMAPTWMFQVGGQVDKAAATRQNLRDLAVFHRQVPVAVAWHGRGRAGIDHYDLFRDDGPNTPYYAVMLRTLRTSYPMLHTDIHANFGHLNVVRDPGFKLFATDRFGRTTTVDSRRGPLHYEQENGSTFTDPRGTTQVFTAAPVAGHGWRTLHGTDFDGGTVLATTRHGAQVRIPIRTYHIMQAALEMTTGPRLGTVEVRIDGRHAGVVDTRSDVTKARVLVAQYRLTAGQHTITLVNLGLRSHAMVQFDGVFLSD
jgi:hypothetical protein